MDTIEILCKNATPKIPFVYYDSEKKSIFIPDTKQVPNRLVLMGLVANLNSPEDFPVIQQIKQFAPQDDGMEIDIDMDAEFNKIMEKLRNLLNLHICHACQMEWEMDSNKMITFNCWNDFVDEMSNFAEHLSAKYCPELNLVEKCFPKNLQKVSLDYMDVIGNVMNALAEIKDDESYIFAMYHMTEDGSSILLDKSNGGNDVIDFIKEEILQ